MKWIEKRPEQSYTCETPVGEFEIFYQFGNWDVYYRSKIVRTELTLHKAKSEANVFLHTLFFKLKMYLELDE